MKGKNDSGVQLWEKKFATLAPLKVIPRRAATWMERIDGKNRRKTTARIGRQKGK